MDDSLSLPEILGKIQYGRRRILLDYDEVTPSNVIEVLQKALPIHAVNRRDCQYLINYALGKQDILIRGSNPTSLVNNTTVINYAYPTTREIIGYTLGSPIEFIAKDNKDRESVQKLNDSYDYEYSYTVDVCAAMFASFCGLGYYITLPSSEISKDNTPEIPLVVDYLDPRDTFVVQSNSIGTPQIMSCTIVRKTNGKKIYTCYTDKYKIIVEGGEIVSSEVNPIGKDPITMLENSLFLTGDWEQAIPVMNASNLVASDSLNEIEGTIKSLLVVLGAEFKDDDTETLQKIKENRLLNLVAPNGTNVDAKFISPQLNSNSVENVRKYLDDARNIITGIPDRENNGNGGDTGTAVLNRNGWTDIEIVSRLKEMFIKKAKKKQIEVGVSILKNLGVMPKDLNVVNIDVSIGRHMSDNLSSRASVFSTLVATGELATIDCLEMSGLTNRVSEVVERGKSEKLEREKEFNARNNDNTNPNDDESENKDDTSNNEDDPKKEDENQS